MAVPYSVTGRCTRVYPSLVNEKATDNLKCYFLKDLWRAHGLDSEANIPQGIVEQQVEHISTFLCRGDIDDHVPKKNSSADMVVPPHRAPCVQVQYWSRIARRIHHWFAVYSIGKPLSSFENSKQLMQVVFDGFTGQQAYEKCKIIHRDISPRHILIDKNGRGILNDWDLAQHEYKLEQLPRHERTGTWQFMSSLLLSRHHYIHTIQDDMESFVYIMLYFGLRYLQHNSTKQIPGLLKRIFDDEEWTTDGLVIGGGMKRSLFNEPENILGSGFEFSCQPFNTWWTWSFETADEWIERCDSDPDTNKATLSVLRVRAEPTQGPVPKPLLYDHSTMAHAFIECFEDWPTDEQRPTDAAPASSRR